MAYKIVNLTLAATAVRLSEATSNGVTLGRKGIRMLKIHNPTGNADVRVGDASVSTTDYDDLIPAATSRTLFGPFSGDAPLNSAEIYFLGTDTQVIHLGVITH